MRTVYKYEIPVSASPQKIAMLHQSQFLAVGWQGNSIQMWMEVDPDEEPIVGEFQVIGTGHEVPKDGQWVGMAEDPALGLIWHVYAIVREVVFIDPASRN